MTSSPSAQHRRMTKTFGRLMVNHSAPAQNTAARPRVGTLVNQTSAARARMPVDIDVESLRMTLSQLPIWAVHGMSTRAAAVRRRTVVCRIPADTTSARAPQATAERRACPIMIARSPGHSASQIVTPHGRKLAPFRLVSEKSSQFCSLR